MSGSIDVGAAYTHVRWDGDAESTIANNQWPAACRWVTSGVGNRRRELDGLIAEARCHAKRAGVATLREGSLNDVWLRWQIASLVALNKGGNLLTTAIPVRLGFNGCAVIEQEGVGKGGVVEAGNSGCSAACRVYGSWSRR